MTDLRPRSLIWTSLFGRPSPQLVYDDPRIGCADLKPLSEVKIAPDDPRSFEQLIADFPVSAEAS